MISLFSTKLDGSKEFCMGKTFGYIIRFGYSLTVDTSANVAHITGGFRGPVILTRGRDF
jgi:hypothetical protein